MKMLDKDLEYIKHEIAEDTIKIYVTSAVAEAICPNCSKTSIKVHSYYQRCFQDLPIQGMKVLILLRNRKYYCLNEECNKTTFAKRFDFYTPNATKTDRLQNEILRVSLSQSSISATKYLRGSVADVGKSTICNMLKKTRENL